MKPDIKKKFKNPYVWLFMISVISSIFQSPNSDHLLHFGIALKKMNPALFPNDVLLENITELYPGFFKYFFILILSYTSPGVVLMIFTAFIKIALILFTFILAYSLFKNKEIALIASAGTIFLKPVLGPTEFGCNYFLARTFVLPFIVFSFYLITKKRYYPAFFLLGILANFHPVSTIYFAIVLFLGLLITFPTKTMFKKLIFSGVLMLIGALPFVIEFFNTPPVTFPDSSLLLVRGKAYFLSLFLSDFGQRMAILKIIPFVGLFFVSMYFKERDKTDKFVLNCSAIILAMIIIYFIIFEIFKITIVMEFYRLLKFLILFAILYGSWFSYNLLKSKELINKLVAIIIIFSIIFFPNFESEYYINDNIFHQKNAQRADWEDVQKWAKRNTDMNDVFITPPHITGFRVNSERSIIGSAKDGGLIIRSREYSILWWERMKDLGYRIEKDGKLTLSYKNFTANEFSGIAKKYNASYVVVETDQELDLKGVYENKHFRIYKISPMS